MGISVLAAAVGAPASSGAAVSKTSESRSRTGAAASASTQRFTLSTLARLRDYAFTYRSGSGSQGALVATGRVRTPTDWQLVVTGGPAAVTTYDVGGHGYAVVSGFSQVQPVTFTTPQGRTHLNGERTWAQAFIGATHVTGMRITAAGPCRVAGERGTTYDFTTPSVAKKIFSLADRACVARSNGALLSFAEGVTGGSAASAVGLRGASQSFTVTSIGRVGPISAPSAPTGTTAPPSTPSVPADSTGLPPGFPSEVPAPPGKITSAAQLSATKWYELLAEASSNAITGYAATLQARGFTVTSQTNTAAADIVELGDASFQVVLEQLSLPGQGVTLTVTVGRS